jgi:hypothetical protein
MRWCTPIIPALVKQRKKGNEFEVSLKLGYMPGYIARPCF